MCCWQIGADAIAMLPPYYTQPPSLAQLMAFLKPVAQAGGPLPMFYYHLPGVCMDLYAYVCVCECECE